MFGSPEARPYIVTYEAGGGVRCEERIVAYDLMEAMMAASVRLAGAGAQDVTVVDVRPDERALLARKARAAMDSVAAHIFGSSGALSKRGRG